MANVVDDGFSVPRDGTLFNGVFRRTYIGLAVASALNITAYAATLNPGQPSAWQLPVGHYVPAKMQMAVKHPRPDTETASWARNRIAYADGAFEYRVRITIQGGAFPFYEDIAQRSGFPSGATISSDPNGSDYMVYKHTPSNGDTSTYSVSTRFYDQDGNYVDIAWSYVCDNSKFVFIDPKAPTNGIGTKSSPLNTMSGIMVNTPGTASAYFGKALVFRAGTTVLVGGQANGNVRLDSNINPCVWMGYPGESAILDFTSSGVVMSGQDDIHISGLNCTNANIMTDGSEYDYIMFWGFNAGNRITFFENNYSNLGWNPSGSGGSSNQAAMTFFNSSPLRTNVSIVDNTINNFAGALLDAYSMNGMVVENNLFQTATATIGEYGLYLKSDLQNISVRQNRSLSAVYATAFIGVVQQAQTVSNKNIEVCYNSHVCPTDYGSAGYNASMIYDWVAQLQNNTAPDPFIWIYRNTFGNWIGALLQTVHVYNVMEENNIILDDAGLTGTYNVTQSGGKQVTMINNITGVWADSIINTSADFVYPYDSNLYTHGYKIG